MIYHRHRAARASFPSLGRAVRHLAFAALLTLGGLAPVGATPLDTGSWMQVGNMSDSDVGMFNGNCDLASTCSYGPDPSDFWSAFPTFPGQKILFITGDRQIWAVADYASVAAIVGAANGVFTPNITWSEAGLGGSSLGGGVMGNILYRVGFPEDPWITLRGPHCAHITGTTFPGADDCNLILWGDNDFIWPAGIHHSLKNASEGMEVYVSTDTDGDDVPDDGTDLCPGTDGNATVDATGCSIAQLCPCDDPWKNHGKYVSCVAHAAEDFLDAGLISEEEKDTIVSEAGQSDCGKKNK